MNGINLVPNQYNKAYYRRWFISLGIVGGILTIIILAFLAYIPVSKIKVEEKKLIELDTQLESEKLKEVKKVLEEFKNVEQEKSDIESTLQNLDIPSHVTRQTMDTIVGSAPKGLRIDEMIIENEGNAASIKGKAKNISNVAQYIVQLYDTGQFENMTYSANQSDDLKLGEWIEYSIHIQFKSLLEEIQDIKEQEQIQEEVGGEESL